MPTTEQKQHKLAEMERFAARRPPTVAVVKARHRAFIKQRRERHVVAKDGAKRIFYVIDGGKA